MLRIAITRSGSRGRRDSSSKRVADVLRGGWLLNLLGSVEGSALGRHVDALLLPVPIGLVLLGIPRVHDVVGRCPLLCSSAIGQIDLVGVPLDGEMSSA